MVRGEGVGDIGPDHDTDLDDTVESDTELITVRTI